MPESIYIPKNELKPYIKFVWHSENYKPASEKERVLPAGSCQLIINLSNNFFQHFKDPNQNLGQKYSHTIVSGVHSHHIFLDSKTRGSTMGVVFHPGGLQAILNIPAGEFCHNVIALDDVINADIPALLEQLRQAPSSDQKFLLLVSFLSSMLDQNNRPNPAIIFAARQINNLNGGQSVSEIANRVGYSRRRFSELFNDVAGISPKEYVRIQRFQNALKTIRSYSEPDWARIAHHCGYYDQAHFNREFKMLSGLTPTGYFRNRTDQINHLPA